MCGRIATVVKQVWLRSIVHIELQALPDTPSAEVAISIPLRLIGPGYTKGGAQRLFCKNGKLDRWVWGSFDAGLAFSCRHLIEFHHYLLLFLQKKQKDDDLDSPFSQLSFYVVQAETITTSTASLSLVI